MKYVWKMVFWGLSIFAAMVLFATVGVLVSTGTFTLFSCGDDKAGFVLITNASGQDAQSASVLIYDKDLRATQLAPGEQKGFFYSMAGDSHHVASVELADGRQMEAEGFYVTSGISNACELVIYPERLEFKGIPLQE